METLIEPYATQSSLYEAINKFKNELLENTKVIDTKYRVVTGKNNSTFYSAKLITSATEENSYPRNYDKTCNYCVRCVRDGIDGLEWSATAEGKMDWNAAMAYARGLVASVTFKNLANE